MVMNPNDTTIGAEVTYSCDVGYEISGQTNRVCQANKTWSATQPTCIESRVEDTCDENDLPLNDWQIEFTYPDDSSHDAHLARRKPPGTIARLKCGHVGYAIVGSNAKVCREGEWHVPEPTCERIRCPVMDMNGGTLEYRDENNRIIDRPHHGDVRIATCPEGFTLSGVSQALCSAGVWLNELPTCQENIPLCIIETIANGNVTLQDSRSTTEGASHGNWRRFTCEQGYTIVGEQESQCLDGEWTSEKPTCVEESCTAVANNGEYKHIYYQGRRTPSDLVFPANTIVEVDCVEGTVPEGPRMAFCRRGFWDPPRLLCVEADEQCVRNEQEVQDQNRRCRRQCGIDSDCRRGRRCVCDDICGLSCIPMDRANYCEDLSSDQTVRVRITPNNRTFGSIAQSDCRNGYEKVGGSNERRCLGSGQWSGDSLNCVPRVRCDQPSEVTNSTHNGTKAYYVDGDVVIYRCDYGYYRSGHLPLSRCNRDEWSEILFQCSPKSCGDPGHVLNGHRIGASFVFLSSVEYTCNPGYELLGTSRRYCQAHQEWSGSLPTCHDTSNEQPCPSPSVFNLVETFVGSDYTPLNMQDTFSEGALLTSRCQDSKTQQFHGTVTRRCEGGRWSGHPARCESTNFVISVGNTALQNVTENGTIIVYPVSGYVTINCKLVSNVRRSISMYKNNEEISSYLDRSEFNLRRSRISNPSEANSGTYKCESNGQSLSIDIIFKAISCPSPAIPTVGSWRHNYAGSNPEGHLGFIFMETVSLTCPRDYRPSDLTRARCSHHGTWINLSQRCIRYQAS
ncbi:CUB and sushi domain-containing protein 3 [Holothuria leucospilota]|uniref:CUB and sushi domain-containing protein 3 n=1 Tax=Holothuria leucospilota TaxID=206669 RepID=A0A9Q1C2Y7_HOLLE|nr:CUB and sushi domain-containing protein 3 [Holothuria leucospilota]